MTETELQVESAKLAAEIVQQDYYVATFTQVASSMQITNIASTPRAELIQFWNAFWEALPDSSSIRRPPFFRVCDLAELIFEDDGDA